MSHRSTAVARPGRVQLLSVVMAVYNEVHTVGDVIDQVLKVDLDGRILELVIVESNSTDGTREVVQSYEAHPNVRVIYQDRPLGKGFAVREGLAAAVGDVVLIQDGDLEYSVDDYPALIEPIERGEAAFVLGSRHVRGKPMRQFAESRRTSVLLNGAHWVFTGLFDLTYRVRLRDPFTMYKVFRRDCIDGLTFSSNRFDFDWELVAKLIRRGHVPVEVPVTYDSRDFESGKKVRLFRDPLTWVVACVRFRFVAVEPQPELVTAGVAARVTPSRPVAVITGGTHGIGRHAADVLAADGWSVAICSRRAEEAGAAAAELEATHGGPAYGAGADVGSVSETRAFAAAVADRLGPPQAVVANAGVLGPVGPLHTIDLDEWAAAVAIDLGGVANTLAAFGAQLAAAGRGSMVTMSGGGVGGPRMATAVSAYTSSKAAVVALTETVARELEPHGVRLNAVAPGAIATGFMDDVLALGPSVAGPELFEQTTRQRQQPDSLDDFDAVLRFLVDPAAPWITGRVLSARWDDLAELSSSPPSPASSWYRLRRIDGVLYDELAVGA